MLYHLAIAVGGLLVLIIIWTTVQSLVRRQSPRPGDDGDVLACNICSGTGLCTCRRVNREQGNERGAGSGEREP